MDKFKFDNITKGINLKNHMIKYELESRSLLLCDLKGFILDLVYIGFIIDDICIIDDKNFLIRIFYNIIIKIKRFNNTIKINEELFIKNQKIYDFIYIKERKLLIISFETFIGIWDINSLFKNPIQIIINNYHNLFNFNSNVFISYDKKKISIYQKTDNIKLYQLSTILTLDNNLSDNKLSLVKLDFRTLMIANKNEIFLFDIRNMITKRKYKFINGKGKINSLYSKEKNIYLNIGDYLYTIRYNKSNLEIINIFYINFVEIIIKESESIEYLFHLRNPILANLKNEDILINNESVKFFSFKHENSIKFFKIIRIGNYLYILPFTNYVDILKERIIIYKDIIKRNMFFSRNGDQSMTGSLAQNERRIEVRKSKRYHIIIGKNNSDKRNKFKKVNKIKIKNNPKAFNKKFR